MFRAIDRTMGYIRKAAPICLTMLLMGSVPAHAQTRPDPMRPNLPRLDDRRDRSSNENQSDFPTTEMRNAVEANARAAYARANFRRLQSSLDQAINRLQYNFERSPDLVKALRAEQEAWDHYVATRNAALKGVLDNPEYQAKIALKADMGDRIAEVRQAYTAVAAKNDRATRVLVDAEMMKQLVTMATVKLDYAQLATDMEVAALRSEPKVADARSRLIAAGSQVQSLRNDFDHAIRESSELASIRDKIEEARLQVITSQAFQSGANVVASEALDYAYYKNRFNYTYPYDGFGYGVYRY